MNPRDALVTQYGLVYRVVGANLTDLTHEESLEQPSRGGNCANWILGHLVGAHNRVMELLGEAPVWDDPSLERAGAEPITRPEDAIDFDAMRERFLASQERCMTALQSLTPEQLDEGGFTDPFGNRTTRGAYLNLLAFHQAYHGGQLGLSRRLVGRPGVIGAPKPAEA